MKPEPKYIEPLSMKVTTINGWHHAQLSKDGKVIDEMRCDDKRDIKWICREMLRWFSKMGGCSRWAESARNRHNEVDERGQHGNIQKIIKEVDGTRHYSSYGTKYRKD